MTNDNLHIGEGIYYTGDMANQSGFGVITAVTSNRWAAVQYNMRLDDGREINAISPSNFSGPGARFQTRKEYNALRQAAIAKMEKNWEAKKHIRRAFKVMA
jgi:hypothetical protein